MLKIIEGGFSSGAHELIKKEILKRVENNSGTYLIVPEQQTVIAEAEMVDYLPGYSPLYFEVTNFTRLANTVFRSLGGLAKEYCNSTHKALIMWKALTELSPLLSITSGKREISQGTVSRTLSAVADMQSHSITAEDLLLAEGGVKAKDKRLSAKLSDLSKIMALYKKLLSEKYADATDDLDAVAEKIREKPTFFADKAIYIEGFTSFTEPQYKLIVRLALCADVTVHLTIPRSAPDAFEFTAPRLSKERLTKIASKNGADVKLIKIDARECKSKFLSQCCDLLWRTSGKICENMEEDALRIFEASTPYEEAAFIAADIRKRVECGDRYRDFAIIARQADNYHGIIDSALSDAKIPYFISKSRDASAFEAVKLIYTAAAALSGGMKREDVISYAKCLPYGISRDACDEFELYTEMWQINGQQFTDSGVWTMNPDGYTMRQSKSAPEILESVNRTRKILIEPLVELSRGMKNAKTVRDYATHLVEFMQNIHLEDLIKERAEKLRLMGEKETALENDALWKIITEALDTLVNTLGETEIDRDGFFSQLKVVFSETKIGRIPSVYDSVTIGSADMIRLSGRKHIYMIGTNRGEFPMAQSDSSYFSDRERIQLEKLGFEINPEVEKKSAQELYFFSRAFSYAEKSVTILYSLSNAQFAAAKRSDVVDRIEDMTDKKVIVKKIADIPPSELIYSPALALESLGNLEDNDYKAIRSALVDTGYTDKVSVAEGNIKNGAYTLSKDIRSLLYKQDLALTQSRIDSYNSCPLSYFCRYNLSLTEDEIATFDARNIGSFIHAILENFFSHVRDEGIEISALTPEMKSEYVKLSAQKYLEELEKSTTNHSKREEVMLQRLCRAVMPVVDGICDEFADSKFTPRFFELSISKDCDNLPEPAVFQSPEGGEIFVYGSIDRVDTYKSENGDLYVRVVDYKTGQKIFSPKDIAEGKNLQMFLYLKSVVDTNNKQFLSTLGVEDGRHPIPAGVIYVKTEIGDVRIDKPSADDARSEILKAQSRLGMLLDDSDSLAAMNMKYIPVKFKKDGTPDKRSQDKLYSIDEWDNLCNTLSESVTQIAEKMKRGEIPAASVIDSAKETPCEYCKFKAFCRNIRI